MQTKGTCQQGESSESSPELAGISERNDEDDGAPLRHTCLRLVALHLNLVSYLFFKKKGEPRHNFDTTAAIKLHDQSSADRGH